MTIALVEFKRQRVRRYESLIFIQPGQYVIVEGDRGIDCGLVVHTWTPGPDGNMVHDCIEGVNVDMSKVKAEGGRMLRMANTSETALLHGEIAALEHHALQACKEKVAEYGLVINLLDCEFQFDRKKVTFYFDSAQAIDFRHLVRDLFKTFGARIWMENVNSKVRNAAPPGAMTQAEKQVALQQAAQVAQPPPLPVPRVPLPPPPATLPPPPGVCAQVQMRPYTRTGLSQAPPAPALGPRYDPSLMQLPQMPHPSVFGLKE